MAIIPFLVLFSLLIFVHEGGHFIFSKLFGVKVKEFGFGYPPRIWGRKIRGTIYSINLIPFGGFARIKGEEGETSDASDADSFATQPAWKRVLIIGGGVLGNFILAWILLTLLFAFGNPTLADKVWVEKVEPGSPAEEAGITSGDYILSFEGERVETADELVSLLNENRGKRSLLEVEREGEVRQIFAVPRVDPPEGEGPLGFFISSAVKYEKTAFWKAPFAALVEVTKTLGQMVLFVFELVGDLFRGEEVLIGGPVAIFAITETYASRGLRVFIQFITFLSMNLIVVNLIPIPALDGGRLLFITIEAIRGKKISPRTERVVNSLGFVFIIIVMILISIKDIQTFF